VKLLPVRWLVAVEVQCEDVVAGVCAGDKLGHVDHGQIFFCLFASAFVPYCTCMDAALTIVPFWL
jgi:hypothetical protein